LLHAGDLWPGNGRSRDFRQWPRGPAVQLGGPYSKNPWSARDQGFFRQPNAVGPPSALPRLYLARDGCAGLSRIVAVSDALDADAHPPSPGWAAGQRGEVGTGQVTTAADALPGLGGPAPCGVPPDGLTVPLQLVARLRHARRHQALHPNPGQHPDRRGPNSAPMASTAGTGPGRSNTPRGSCTHAGSRP
jgi:hypothetical protein